MINIMELLKDFSKMGITFASDNGNLKITGAGNLTEEQITIIRNNKFEIIDFIETKGRVKTPSDFTLPGLTTSEYKRILDKNGLKEYEIEDIYNLTPLQEGILFHVNLEKDSTVYFEQFAMDIDGNLNVELFKKSWERVIQRQDALRTLFDTNHKIPLQIVLKRRELDFIYSDIRNEDDKTLILSKIKKDDRSKSFNLKEDPLLRIKLIYKGDSNYLLLFSFHHIILDGWCMATLLNDFFTCYMSLAGSNDIEIDKPVPYSNYINFLNNKENDAAIEFWKKYLDGYNKKAQVPQDSFVDYEGDLEQCEFSFKLDKKSTDSIIRHARKSEVSLNTVIQLVWGIILSRYNNSSDVVFGATVSGRPKEVPGIEKIIGLFINAIPVRIKLDNLKTFEQAVSKVQEQALECLDHHYYSLADIQGNTVLGRELLNHVLVFENYPLNNNNDEFSKIMKINNVDIFEQVNYDFALGIIPNENLNFRINYNPKKYSEETIKRISSHILKVLEDISNNWDKCLDQIDILTNEERELLIKSFNNTKTTFPEDMTMHGLFQEQVKKRPEDIAIISSDDNALHLWPSTSEYFIYDEVLYNAMINDRLRNDAYLEAFRKVVKDKVVLDVGTGKEAILSKLCVEAGAKKVYAIDILEESYNLAKQEIEKLGLENKITVIQGDATKTSLPEKVDVIVSEIVGAIGGSEGSAAILNRVRHHLKPDGIMVPGKTQTKMAAISLPEDFIDSPAFSELSKFYVDRIFSDIGKEFDLRLCLRNFSKEYLISNEDVFENLDHTGIADEESEHTVNLLISRSAKLHGFALWLYLDLFDGVELDVINHEHCWLPVYVPAFYPGVEVEKNDHISMVVKKSLCSNNLNPDFFIEGKLIKKNGIEVPFTYDVPHIANSFKKDTFYKKIFNKPLLTIDNRIKKTSYKNIDTYSSNLQTFLKKDIKENKKVIGVLLDRNESLIISLLGILKSGYTYLPLSPEYPEERLKYFLDETGCDTIISCEKYFYLVDRILNKKYIDIYCFTNSNTHKPAFESSIDSENDAYIIFTSGSTGKPKGTLLNHKGFVNMILSQIDYFGVTPEDTVLQFASTTFDASLSEIFMALGAGSTLFMVNETDKYDTNNFAGILKDNNVTVATLPPNFLSQIGDALSLKTLITAGESPDRDLAKKYSKKLTYINAYGPTETSVCATYYKVDPDKNYNSVIPIGGPINNCQIIILSNNNLAPIGVAGEICISGVGLSKGYINRPCITKEKFLDNPFVENNKMYRTGDLGRWTNDGNIEYIGRIDNQVKVRGYRIELGEIENVLLQFSPIDNCTVLVKEDNAGFKEIIAFYVADKELDISEIRSHLGSQLPEYMVPSYFKYISKMPLTVNGKVDKKQLLELETIGQIKTEVYVPPKNELQEKIVSIWEDVLGVNKIGINDNFFNLGGHSLKATKVVSRITTELSASITLNELFHNATVQDISEMIEGKKKEDEANILNIIGEVLA